MSYRIRIAKTEDIPMLAHVHWLSSSVQPGAFMYKLGEPFFRAYYRVILAEKYSLVLCAEDESGQLLGLVSGSLRTEEHVEALKKARLRFFLASVLRLLVHPSLVSEIYPRQKLDSGGGDRDPQFVMLTGPRLEYWGWDPEQKSKIAAVPLLKKWLQIAQQMGVTEVHFEVDLANPKSRRVHEILGSQVVRDYVTADGRARSIMRYCLDQQSRAIQA